MATSRPLAGTSFNMAHHTEYLSHSPLTSLHPSPFPLTSLHPSPFPLTSILHSHFTTLTTSAALNLKSRPGVPLAANHHSQKVIALSTPRATLQHVSSTCPGRNKHSSRQATHALTANAVSTCSKCPGRKKRALTANAVSTASDTTTEGIPGDAAEGCRVEAKAVVAVLVGASAGSPFMGTPWLEVMEHMAKRVSWIEPGVEVIVLADTSFISKSQEAEQTKEEAQKTTEDAQKTKVETQKTMDEARKAVEGADVVLGVELWDPEAGEFIQRMQKEKETVICFDSDPALVEGTVLGGVRLCHVSPPLMALAKTGIWKKGSEALKVDELVRGCWERRKADDVWFTILALVNAYVMEVGELRSLRAAGLDSLQCMIGNCSSEIRECFADPNCRAAIQCLNQCGPTDQVCSYRCIVSYESSHLEAFSLCVLQKHNCLGLSANIRTLPVVHPMTAYRGEQLTHDVAEGIFIGWLGGMESSWRVVAGQNAAYDQFPCQFQIFYRGKARGSFWYDPVFKVKKYDGTVVWRRRHYRVRRGEIPGTFTFSVLDNGVISEEFWKIADATDDLSWALFYYSGAAKAAGQSYSGAVLVTPDGAWPGDKERERLTRAFESCGIKEWELFSVDNSACESPPLGLPSDAPEQKGLL